MIKIQAAHCLHHIFEQTAKEHHNSAALEFNDQSISYHELNRQANQLAHHLQAQGVRPNVLVGLFMERSMEMIVAMLAILKAGGAYMPIDPTYPQERMSFMLKDSGISLLLTQEKLKDQLPTHNAQILCMDTQKDLIAANSDQNPEADVSQDTLAYMIYTSGSTGIPKGVLVAHRGLSNLSEQQQKILQLTSDDRVVQFSSISFDGALIDIILAFSAGATLCLAHKDELLPGKALAHFLQSKKINVGFLPPATLNVTPEENLSDLRILLVGGEACSKEIIQRWAKDRTFFNIYGPTETSVWMTYAPCDVTTEQITIGKPIPNTKVFLLNDEYQPVPQGETGEICIGGVGVAEGYHNRLDLNKEKFIPNKIDKDGTKLYRTGDLARFLPNGNIDFIGRMDHQVKLRGYRIELGEIEALLTQHKGLQGCAVLATDDRLNEKQLMAFVVRTDPSITVDDLRSFLAQHLPHYMIPNVFIFIEEMPLTSNRKIDRRALENLAQNKPHLTNAYTAPSNKTEEALVEIWQKALHINQIGIKDSFFELGGHSLTATQIMSEIREHFQIDISLRVLFEQPTISQLATHLEESHQQISSNVLSLQKISRQGKMPLSHGQKHIWVMNQLTENQVTLNDPMVLKLEGELDVPALEQALDALMDRHEVLRTTVDVVDGELYAHIHDKVQIPLEKVSLENCSDEEAATSFQELLDQELNFVFDLEAGPIVRTLLVSQQATLHHLVLNIHHIAFDGWSTAILMREITTLYHDFKQGRSALLPALDFQYADYAQWQQQRFESEDLTPLKKYWQETLRHAPHPLPMPTDYPRPTEMNFTAASETFLLDGECMKQLEQLSHQTGGTLYMTLFSLFAGLMASFTQNEDLVIASPVVDRPNAQLNELVGLFVNVLPLRINLKGNPTFKELMERVRHMSLSASEHQELPFNEILEEAHLAPDIRYSPLSQLIFNMINIPQEKYALEDLNISSVETYEPTATSDIAFFVYQYEENLRVRFHYRTELFKSSTIQKLMAQFKQLIQVVLDNPDTRLSEAYTTCHLDPDSALASQKKEDPLAYYHLFSNLSRSQLLFWIAQQMMPDNPVYNSTIILDLKEEINEDVFKEAFSYVFHSRDSLRTVITEKEGIPQRQVADHLQPDVEIINLSNEEDPQATADVWIQEASRNVFSLDQCLYKCALLKLAQDHYIWYIGQHHIITDGWSNYLIYDSLSKKYRALLSGDDFVEETSSLDEYVAFERAFLKSPRYTKAKDYWKASMAKNDGGMSFYSRAPQADRLKSVRMSHSLKQEEIQTIADIFLADDFSASTRDAKRVYFYLAVYATYLSLISGKKSLMIGVPIHNRRAKFLKNLTGLVMHFAPLYVEIQPEDTVFSLMKRIEAEMRKVVQFGQYLVHNTMAEPIYDVVFNYQVYVGQHFDKKEHGTQWIHPKQIFESMALNITGFICEKNGNREGVNIDFDLKESVFNEGLSEQVTEHFLHILTQASSDINQPVGNIDLLPAQEQKLLKDFNKAPQPPYSLDENMISLFARQVQKSPQAVAVTYEDRVMTYSELDQQSNQLAHYLRQNNIQTNDLIGICSPTDVDLVVGLLGILKTGAAYVPIDFTYPQARKQKMREGAELKMVLFEEQSLEEMIQGQPTDALAVDIAKDQLVYMIFTSGSTGIPKGAGVYHRGFLNLLQWYIHEFQLTSQDNTLVISSLSFDLTQKNIFAPLLVGGTVHLRNPALFDPMEIASLIEQHQCSWLNCTPSAFGPIVEEAKLNDYQSLASLRYLFLGGEPIVAERLKDWVQTPACSTQIVNSYGPTECTDVTTYFVVEDLESFSKKPIPIGQPIPHVEHYILNDDLKPVAMGMTGELCIAGDCVGAGYLHDASLTKEKFVFSSFANNVVYKTGDLACYLPDGTIQLSGRMDDQVKIRGHRIELGEIENVLHQNPFIQEVVVVAKEDQAGKKSLIAYVVTKEEKAVSDDLRAHLLEHIPDYMMPGAFIVLDKMPLSPNGKVDRKALPDPEAEEQQLTTTYVPPSNPVEEQLAQIWIEVLHVSRVGVHDNFFELGGHSIIATQLISRIRAELKTEIPLRAFFSSPTVFQISQMISSEKNNLEPDSSPQIVPVSRDQKLPLSLNQKRLWVLHEIQPDTHAYNMPMAVRINGDLNVPLLERTLNHIINRQESLRTNFKSEEGEPFLKIHEECSLTLACLNLSELSEDRRDADLKAAMQHEAEYVFNLAKDKLFRAKILKTKEQEYILLLTMHHIISDAWSLTSIIQEINEIYPALLNYAEPNLPALSVQYADYTHWQEQWFKDDKFKKQLDYWREKMKGAPPLLELPTDRVRPPVERPYGQHFDFELSPALTKRIYTLGQNLHATTFMVLHAAFTILLSRYSGQDDIVLGTPSANRNSKELEPLIGFFINTVLLRSDLSGTPTFKEYLSRIKQTDLEAFERQEVPFEHLVETLKPGRSLSHSPWFQVLFVLQNTPGVDNDSIEGLEFSLLEPDLHTAKFDITLGMYEDETALKGGFEYKTDLFDEETMQRMSRHFIQLLEAITEDPEKMISQYSLVDKEEGQELLTHGDGVSSTYPKDKCIHELFEAQAKKTPQAIAVQYEDQQLTYEELNTKANLLAHCLRAKGSEPNTLIGLCMNRSPDMIIALLGILKSGAAYVPLDPTYPNDRLLHMIQDSQLKCVVTTEEALKGKSLLFAEELETVCMDKDWETIYDQYEHQAHKAPNGYPLNSQNLAYVIYTSGSTGKPKGVMVEHRSLVNYASFAADEYKITPHDCVLQFASICFDAAGEEIYPALISGATLHLRTQEMIATSETFLQKCQEWGITLLDLPTAYWHQIAADLKKNKFTIPTSIRVVIIGGERALPELVQMWQREVGATPVLYNTYGPTEATIVATYKNLSSPESSLHELREVSIGRAVANTHTFILDQDQNPVSVGIPGELYIAGDGLARGYLHQDELTAQKFPEINMAGQKNIRAYKTGDVCRYLPNGEIEFRGRVDNQVKIRGFRIELGEIESVLQQHVDVQASAVIVKEEGPRKILIGFFVTENKDLDAEELKAFIKNRLPSYMVPAVVMPMETMPITGSGKVDYNSLRNMRVEYQRSAQYMAARHDIDQKLIDIWSELLGAQKIGIKDNFFDLGGHSLIATQLLSRIIAQYHVDLKLMELFQLPTILEMSDRIETLLITGRKESYAPIEPREQIAVVPAVPGQERLYELFQMAPENPRYNMGSAFELNGALDQQIFERVFAELVQRHEILRTTFTHQDGELVQVIHSDGELPFEVVDMTDWPASEKLAQAKKMAVANLERPINLDSTESLVKGTAYKVSGSKWVFSLVMHHIISDGWSIEVIVREMAAIYGAFIQNQPSPLPQPQIQFGDFAIWQKEWLQSPASVKQIEYWKDQLTGAPAVLELKTDRPRPAVRSFKGGLVSFEFDSEFINGVQSLAQKFNVTNFMVLLALYSMMLHQFSDQEDILIGSSSATRNREDTEGLVGLFTNNLVLRLQPTKDICFSTFLEQIKKVCLGAYDHQDIPFEMIPEALGIQSTADKNPLFQATFTYLSAHASATKDEDSYDLLMKPIPMTTATSKYDVTLTVNDDKDEMSGSICYNSDIFERDTVEKMLQTMKAALYRVLQNPNSHAGSEEVKNQSSSSSLVPISRGNDALQKPFFCVHPIGGNVFGYVPLAKHLGKDQPFYGFKAIGLEGEEPPLKSIPEIAARYIQDLLAVQKEGPFSLGGWSFGGLVAFEMAHQLIQQGHAIQRLALIDSSFPIHLGGQPNDASMMKLWVAQLEAMFGKQLHIKENHLKNKSEEEKLKVVLAQAQACHLFPKETTFMELKRLFDVYKAHTKAFYNYQPKQYSGKVDLCIAEDHFFGATRLQRDVWGSVTSGGLSVYKIPGNHYSMMQEPHVQKLAAAFNLMVQDRQDEMITEGSA